jgi:hypothetical protein
VLLLLTGLTVTLLAMSGAPDPKRQAAALVSQIKAAVANRAVGAPLFGSAPLVQRSPQEVVVTVDRIPPKVCVLASWDLYRLGIITINGVTPNRVSAARLVELCNEFDTASLSWTVRSTTP